MRPCQSWPPGASARYHQVHAAQPVVFVNLYNNVYGTNFQQWTDQLPPSTVRIWAVDRKSSESQLVTPSWEGRQPCVAAACRRSLGPFAADAGRFGAFAERNAHHGLWPQSRRRRHGVAALGAGWRRRSVSRPVAGRVARGDRSTVRPAGRTTGDPLPIRDGAITIPLGHFAPASVILSAVGSRAVGLPRCVSAPTSSDGTPLDRRRGRFPNDHVQEASAV